MIELENVEPNTKFPKPEFVGTVRDDLYVTTKENLNAWFKRCIEDFPIKGAYFTSEKPVITWFDKWFTQFKETET